ncbi:MAG: phosphatase PAP2 family protein [Gemmatimonadales bacterium]|nr:MAG: phosphatase PAP2 family protein [Gemmatimonadales bacterium]
MEDLGVRIILWVQEFRTPALDMLARGLSFLGDEPFYLLLIPVLYWAVDRSTGLRLTILFLVSAWLNALLKGWVDLPRPSPADVAVLIPEDGGGVPSGHAQHAVVVWGYLLWVIREWGRSDSVARVRRMTRWALPAAIALILLIGVSRIYLGVHFPHDVVVGWGVGAIYLAAWILAVERFGEAFRGALSKAVPVGVFAPFALLWIYRGHTALPAAATLLGAGIGAWFERRHLRFDSSGTLRRRLLRLLAGLPVAAAIWLGLRGVSWPSEDLARTLRYSLLGFWLTAGAPFLFVRTGLAGREQPQLDSADPALATDGNAGR